MSIGPSIHHIDHVVVLPIGWESEATYLVLLAGRHLLPAGSRSEVITSWWMGGLPLLLTG